MFTNRVLTVFAMMAMIVILFSASVESLRAQQVRNLRPRPDSATAMVKCGAQLEEVKTQLGASRRYVFTGSETLKDMRYCVTEAATSVVDSSNKYRVPAGTIGWLTDDGTKVVLEGCVNDATCQGCPKYIPPPPAPPKPPVVVPPLVAPPPAPTPAPLQVKERMKCGCTIIGPKKVKGDDPVQYRVEIGFKVPEDLQKQYSEVDCSEVKGFWYQNTSQTQVSSRMLSTTGGQMSVRTGGETGQLSMGFHGKLGDEPVNCGMDVIWEKPASCGGKCKAVIVGGVLAGAGVGIYEGTKGHKTPTPPTLVKTPDPAAGSCIGPNGQPIPGCTGH